MVSRLSQSDFDSLAIPEQSEDPLFDPCPPKSPELSQKKTTDTYVPVNVIPQAVYAMIAAWEQSEVNRQDVMDGSGSAAMTAPASLSGALSLNNYEPMRICNFEAPPKRFHRTFWRSLARRILDSDKLLVYKKLEEAAYKLDDALNCWCAKEFHLQIHQTKLLSVHICPHRICRTLRTVFRPCKQHFSQHCKHLCKPKRARDRAASKCALVLHLESASRLLWLLKTVDSRQYAACRTLLEAQWAPVSARRGLRRTGVAASCRAAPAANDCSPSRFPSRRHRSGSRSPRDGSAAHAGHGPRDARPAAVAPRQGTASRSRLRCPAPSKPCPDPCPSAAALA